MMSEFSGTHDSKFLINLKIKILHYRKKNLPFKSSFTFQALYIYKRNLDINHLALMQKVNFVV